MKVIELNKDKEIDWLINEIRELHELDGLETLICVYRKKDKVVALGATAADSAAHLGLLEIGKQQILNELQDE
jgi:hypothetical protein